MTRIPILLSFLFLLTFPLAAQVIFFDRQEPVGSVRKAQLRLKLSREYMFMIPGAGKPIRKLETIDLVLLTGIKIEKLNSKGQPVTLLLTPEILGGSLNGRSVKSTALRGRKIRAELGAFPCTFTALDGKTLSEEESVILSALFRPQQNIQISDLLGKSRRYQPGGRWTPDVAPIINNISERNVILQKKNLSALATFENKFKVNGIECVAIVLNLSSIGTHAYDFQVKTRIIFPVKKEDGGIIRLAREGVEVIDRKTVSGDVAAAGSSLRVVTKEQMEVTYILPEKSQKRKKSIFF